VLAVQLPDLPLQRLRRAREPAIGGGRPIVVLGEGLVACCDDAARAAGVRPGMTAAEAHAACGRLAVFPADPAADRAALRALAEALLGLAPAIEVSAPDVLLMDASAAHLVAGGAAGGGEEERTLAEKVLAVVVELGYAGRAVLATGRGPARALVAHGWAGDVRIRRVPPGDTARALAPLPVAALGLERAVAARIAALGLAAAGALARLPEGTLAHRFGPDGVAAARLARGEDPSPLVPYTPETFPEEAIELEAPAESAEPVLFVLKRLADRVAARLAGRGLGASRLRLVLRLDPRGEERIAVPLAQPTASAARWLGPMREHLFALRLPGAVIGLRLAAVEVSTVAAEQLAFGDRPEVAAALEGVLARLAARLGDGALFAAEPVERYRPEGAYRAVAFGPRLARGARAAPAAPVEASHRPTRLLATPELVVAEGEGGRLTAIRVGGRDRAVLGYEGPERLAGEWWCDRFERDYYRVRLDGLGECWIFRDGADGRLYLHGFFD
jgi:protein ImuB